METVADRHRPDARAVAPAAGRRRCATGSGSSRPPGRCSSSSAPMCRSTRSPGGPASATPRSTGNFPDRAALIHEVVSRSWPAPPRGPRGALAAEADAVRGAQPLRARRRRRADRRPVPDALRRLRQGPPRPAGRARPPRSGCRGAHGRAPGRRAAAYRHRRRRPDGRPLPAHPAAARHRRAWTSTASSTAICSCSWTAWSPGPLRAARIGRHPGGPEAPRLMTPATGRSPRLVINVLTSTSLTPTSRHVHASRTRRHVLAITRTPARTGD